MLEKLSKIAHESWAGWTKYFFEKGKRNEDGTITIPKWGVERWERQIETDYKDLTEKEKESDRTEAKKYLEIFSQYDKNVNIDNIFSNILSFYVPDGNPEIFKQKIEQYKSELMSL